MVDAWRPVARHLAPAPWRRAFPGGLRDRDGLPELLDARLYTSAMEFQKPHPSAFRAALDALRVGDPGDAVFVGDRPFDDIYGAGQAGMRAVLRRNDGVPAYDVEPDAVIDRLTELVPLLACW